MKFEVETRRLSLGGLLCSLALSAQAITGATPTNAFNAVGAGVQVTPDWVMTVAHAALAPNSLYDNGYGLRTVAAVYAAPGSEAGFPAHDFALLRLVPAATAAPSLAVNGALVPAGTFPPWDVTIASAANAGPARAYAYTTVTESLFMVDPDDEGPLQPVEVNWLVSWDTLVHVQNGDSGSGLFVGHVVDSSMLIGLSSELFEDEEHNPLGSGFVQPAAYRNWIDATMAADLADNQTVLWATAAVPEPATWALWAGAWAFAAARRMRAQARQAGHASA